MTEKLEYLRIDEGDVDITQQSCPPGVGQQAWEEYIQKVLKGRNKTNKAVTKVIPRPINPEELVSDCS